MLAALPLILSIAPEIARWLGGDQASTVTAAVANAIRSITGKEDPNEAAKVIESDADKAAELRVKLAQIAADAEARQREADLQMLKAQLDAAHEQQQTQLESFKTQIEDLKNARGDMVDLAKSGSPIAWGAPVLSVVIIVAFGVILYAVLQNGVRQESLAIANILLGTLAAMATQVANFWLGSSSSSSRKDDLIQNAQTQLSRSVPASILPKPAVMLPASAVPDGDAPLSSGGQLRRAH